MAASSLVCQFLHNFTQHALILNPMKQSKSNCHPPYPANIVSVALHTLLFLAIDATDNFFRLETTLDQTSYDIPPTTVYHYLGHMDKFGSNCSPLQYNNTSFHSRRQSAL